MAKRTLGGGMEKELRRQARIEARLADFRAAVAAGNQAFANSLAVMLQSKFGVSPEVIHAHASQALGH